MLFQRHGLGATDVPSTSSLPIERGEQAQRVSVPVFEDIPFGVRRRQREHSVFAIQRLVSVFSSRIRFADSVD